MAHQEITPFYPEYNFDRDLIKRSSRSRVADFMRDLNLDKQAERYENCRQHSFLMECKNHAHDRCRGSSKAGLRGLFLAPHTCKSRICEPCARAYGLRYRKRLLPYIESLVGKSNLRRLKFVTLTFKQEKAETISPAWVAFALKCVGRLVRKVFYPKTKAGQALGGAIAVLEISPNGFFHVHLLAYGYYVSKPTLDQAWLKITGDSYVTDIRDASKAGVAAVDEILKYIVKPLSLRCDVCGSSISSNTDYCLNCGSEVVMPADHIVEVISRYLTAIKGRRRIHTWGIFYNNNLKLERVRAVCPFCGSPLELFSDKAYDNGSYWPVWRVNQGLENNDVLPRYG